MASTSELIETINQVKGKEKCNLGWYSLVVICIGHILDCQKTHLGPYSLTILKNVFALFSKIPENLKVTQLLANQKVCYFSI